MTDLEKINNYKYILAKQIYEPGENQLAIKICLGHPSEVEDYVSPEKTLGMGNEILFDDNEVYTIYFSYYIAYFVINESFDNQAIGNFSGDRIREYSSSPFREFCKEETLGYQLNPNNPISHYGIITERHILNFLTTCKPQIIRQK